MQILVFIVFITTSPTTGYAKSLMMKKPAVPGVCMVTSGPGLTNMITPMVDAQYDSTPLIVFSGQVSMHVFGVLYIYVFIYLATCIV